MKVNPYIGMLVLLLMALTASVIAEGEPTINITETNAFYCAVMDTQGSYKNMEKNIFAFIAEFSKQGLQPTGPMMSIYFNSPAKTAEANLKWATGFPVSADVEVKAPLRKVAFKDQKTAVYLHVGPYEQLTQSYATVFAFIEKKGFKPLWPTYDRYLNSPMEVVADKLETEIIIPVVAK